MAAEIVPLNLTEIILAQESGIRTNKQPLSSCNIFGCCIQRLSNPAIYI